MLVRNLNNFAYACDTFIILLLPKDCKIKIKCGAWWLFVGGIKDQFKHQAHLLAICWRTCQRQFPREQVEVWTTNSWYTEAPPLPARQFYRALHWSVCVSGTAWYCTDNTQWQGWVLWLRFHTCGGCSSTSWTRIKRSTNNQCLISACGRLGVGTVWSVHLPRWGQNHKRHWYSGFRDGPIWHQLQMAKTWRCNLLQLWQSNKKDRTTNTEVFKGSLHIYRQVVALCGQHLVRWTWNVMCWWKVMQYFKVIDSILFKCFHSFMFDVIVFSHDVFSVYHAFSKH